MRVPHVPLEFASLFVRFVRHRTLEDRAEEQEPPCAVVHLLVGRAVVLQHVIYDLPIPRVSTKWRGRMEVCTDLAQNLHDFKARTTP